MHPTEGLDHPAITHAWGRRGVHVKRLRLELNIRKEGSEVEPRQAPREACSLATRLRRLSKRHGRVALWTRTSDSPPWPRHVPRACICDDLSPLKRGGDKQVPSKYCGISNSDNDRIVPVSASTFDHYPGAEAPEPEPDLQPEDNKMTIRGSASKHHTRFRTPYTSDRPRERLCTELKGTGCTTENYHQLLIARVQG
jgi:hypothetical protein